MNTLSLIERAIEIRSDEGPYDQIWCVFDLDDFPRQNFDLAIRRAEKENIRIAYSNEAVELWYVLHFDYLQAQLNRKQYIGRLTELLAKPYSKSDIDMYRQLLPKQKIAIKHAQKLLEEHHAPHLNPSAKTPSTTVHELVLELNRHIRKS